ncbi:MAG: asparagine synthase (glutamine-hydrolyzing) [Candidatus Omnitrophica bacterium]|nr:asparagine synthase (glutamine-hydrolyzing) [Candidatus Omnitrophota bacterium]
MCGFVTYFDRGPSNFSKVETLKTMTRLLSHRGPDGEGFLTPALTEIPDAFLGLGHQRLSILDLSPAGAQPMCNQEQTLWLVYNGEIFNYLEIRAELIQKGRSFKSDSDTEVILEAYAEWGVDCLKRFNGMWAFVLWDVRKNILFCARDRFGIKPFYYYQDRDRFLCASEIKSILAHPQVARKPNEEMIFDYLSLGLQDHTPHTFFQSIEQIPPSHYGIYSLKTSRWTLEKWWDISLTSSNSSVMSPDEFLDLLQDSVRIRLRSDVPVGLCMSGGLDSTAIGYLVEKADRETHPSGTLKRKAFSACFEMPECDDRKFIHAAVQGLQMEGYETFPQGRELWKDLPHLTQIMDEPFYSSNQFSQWSLMRLIGQHKIRVALSGQGSDEYLGGYRGYGSVFLADALRRGQWQRFFHEWRHLPSKANGLSQTVLFSRILYGLMPGGLRSSSQLMLRLKSLSRTKGIALMAPAFYQRHESRLRDYLHRRERDWSDIRHKLYQDLFTYSLPQLLHYEDRNGMAFSVETRHPFLDHRLVEKMFTLSADHLMRDGQQKWILRRSVQNLIPEIIWNRKDKKGFITPEDSWMQEGRTYIQDLFTNRPLTTETFLDRVKMNVLTSKSQTHQDNYNLHTDLWRPLHLEVWMRQFWK